MQDIVEFIFFPVVNEGCRVIDEGEDLCPLRFFVLRAALFELSTRTVSHLELNDFPSRFACA